MKQGFGVTGDEPLLQVHHGRTFVLKNGFIRMDAHVEFSAELACLEHDTGVTFVTP